MRATVLIALSAFACAGSASLDGGTPADAVVTTPLDGAPDGAVASASDAVASDNDASTNDASAPDSDSGASVRPDAGGVAFVWRSCARLPGGPRQETAVVALGAELYVLGGFDNAAGVVRSVEIYDPNADTWRNGPSLPVGMHHANAAVLGSRLYILGFLTGLDFRADGRSYVLADGGDRWDPIAPLPVGTERGGGATAVVGERIWVVGGLRGNAVRDVTVYTPSLDAHAPGPPLPAPRDHLGATAVGDRVIVIGGRNARIESHQPDTWILDSGAMTWRSGRPMPTSRGGFALSTLGGRVFVFGGEGDTAAASGVFDDVESYDVAADDWRVDAPMPAPRHGTGAATLADRSYVPGGAEQQAFAAVDSCASYGL